MHKRGLSTVVTTLIIILLVLVAVGIVWIVIRNLIEEGTEEVTLGKFTIDLAIKQVNINPGSIDIRVKRNPGKGELSAIKFLVSDGANVQEFKETTSIGELGEQTFTLDYSGLVKEISIAPVLESGSGNEILGNVVDKETFTNKETLENLGAVSWWRLGNGNDEISNNNGVLNGGVDCNVAGKFGNACNFDGIDDYIQVADDDSLDIVNEISIVMWVYPTNFSHPGGGNYPTPISKGSNYRLFISRSTSRLHTRFGSFSDLSSSQNLQLDTWTFIVVTFDGNGFKIYFDSNLDNSDTQSGILSLTSANLLIGNRNGLDRDFQGTIDEVMIFNRALSEDEITALYNLDLS